MVATSLRHRRRLRSSPSFSSKHLVLGKNTNFISLRVVAKSHAGCSKKIIESSKKEPPSRRPLAKILVYLPSKSSYGFQHFFCGSSKTHLDAVPLHHRAIEVATFSLFASSKKNYMVVAPYLIVFTPAAAWLQQKKKMVPASPGSGSSKKTLW